MKNLSRTICFIFILTGLIFPVTTASWAQASGQDVGLCKKDEDCVVIQNGCIAGAVNKRYEGKAEKFIHQVDKKMDSCDEEMKGENIKSFAYCQKTEVDCHGRYTRKGGDRCYSEKGTCVIKYY